MFFEFVYKEISGESGKNKDAISINFFMQKNGNQEMHRGTYDRGMTELWKKAFYFSSVAADIYFVNVRFMFNGDRMVLVKTYRRKGVRRSKPGVAF